MRIQVPVRILNRDHRADKVIEFNPVRLHVRTDSISLQVAIHASRTPLTVFCCCIKAYICIDTPRRTRHQLHKQA